MHEEKMSRDITAARRWRRWAPLRAFFALTASCLLYALVANSSGDPAVAAGFRRGGPPASVPAAEPSARPVVIQGTVKKGETISSLLGEWLAPRDIELLARRSRGVFSLRKIRQGRPYAVRILDGAFQSFEYEIDSEEKLIRAEPDGFAVDREPIACRVAIVPVCGTIQTSLSEAVDEIGESPVLALKLVDIFGWDVDFVLDVRAGDSFKAIVEKRYRDGEFAGYGRILAAEFINRGKTYQGFLFENREGHPEYYDAKGRSLRRAFLKAPLHYAHISSRFSWHRFHPIKKKWCPHPAIDYAAPVGTPVRTVGDGVVSATGYDRGGGNYIKIRHNSVYQTCYMHLSRFARGIKKGRKVHQGQIIGYVGNTGMSTGPHLDFRMKKNGRFVNPARIIAPASPPVPRERIEAFRETVRPLLARLDAVKVPVAVADLGSGTAAAAPPGAANKTRDSGQNWGQGGP